MSSEVKQMIENFYQKNYANVAPEWEILVDETVDDEKESERLNIIKKYIPIKKEWNILEVGGGFGNFQLYMDLNGYTIAGIEPDEDCIKIINKRFEMMGKKSTVIEGVGENLPFPDASFDLIISFQVLEHVQNVKAVLKECFRVCKPGGYIYIVVPNYNSFWEPHYSMIFPTFLGKNIFKTYVKMRGRKASFASSLNFITWKMLKKLICYEEVEVISTGKELFKSRFQKDQVPEWGQTSKLVKISNLIIKLKLNKLIGNILCAFNMHYPINLVMRKK